MTERATPVEPAVEPGEPAAESQPPVDAVAADEQVPAAPAPAAPEDAGAAEPIAPEAAPAAAGATAAPAEAQPGPTAGGDVPGLAESAPASPGTAAGEPAVDESVPLAIPGEQIEWQPVVTGEQIEWQPVVVSDSEAAWVEDATGEHLVQEPYAAEYAEAEAGPGQGSDADAYGGEPATEGWDPTAVPVGGNGSGNGTGGAPVAPPARPPRRSGPPPPSAPTAKDAGAGGAAGGPPAKAKRQVVVLSVLTGVVVLVAVFGFVLSRGASKKGGQASGPTTTSVSVVTVPAADLTTFHDDQTGFTVKYPKTWKQLGLPVSDIRLTLDAGNNDGMQVRIFPIQTPATTENIANLKAVTDTIVFGNPNSGFQEIQEQLVTLNGKLTYYYIYTFPDPVTEQQGVHVTYFVFEGHRMFEMVFQAVPADDFKQEAGIFDQVAESFTVDPEKPTTTSPATGPAPTAPPTSTP